MKETASPKQNHDQFPSTIGVVEQMQQWTAVKAGDIRLMNAEMQLIRTLGCHDGISVGELCSKLYLDSGTITPLLKKMEEKGYIERRRSHEDERVVFVYLTEEGRDLRNEAKNIPTNVGQCIHLEPDEAVCLYSLLYKILGQKNQ